MSAYTTIDNPELYFQVKTYTGDGNDDRNIVFDVTDTSLQPDLLWSARRDSGDNLSIYDSVRGDGKELRTAETGGSYDRSDNIQALNSNGFQVGTDGQVNASGGTYVSWAWKAGTAFSNDASATSVGNTDSSGSASSTAGFSIAIYEGVGASLDIVVKHGLSAVPKWYITKNLDDANNWSVYHHKNTSAPETDYLRLDTDTATTDEATIWADTAPTSAVFTAGDHSSSNRAGDSFVGYFWNEVQGYSKFGTFTGNGNDDGPFVYTGFRPAWTMIKCTSAADHWPIDDNKRSTSNFMQNTLRANLNNAEYTGSAYGIDFLSNGFKVRNDDGQYNLSGGTFVYMAFAEQPFVNSNGVPCNAR